MIAGGNPSGGPNAQVRGGSSPGLSPELSSLSLERSGGMQAVCEPRPLVRSGGMGVAAVVLGGSGRGVGRAGVGGGDDLAERSEAGDEVTSGLGVARGESPGELAVECVTGQILDSTRAGREGEPPGGVGGPG